MSDPLGLVSNNPTQGIAAPGVKGLGTPANG